VWKCWKSEETILVFCVDNNGVGGFRSKRMLMPYGVVASWRVVRLHIGRSQAEFVERFEKPGLPCIIKGCMDVGDSLENSFIREGFCIW
jgi:hypothetical protein